MGNFATFFVCLLVSAAFFLVLYFKFLNDYMTFDKDKEKCESNKEGDCNIWYSQYGLCLKGIKDETGACQQKNILIPLGLIFGGLFFALFSIVSLF